MQKFDLKTAIISDNSVANCRKISSYVLEQKSRFRELMHYFMGPDNRLAQYAARPVNFCVEKDNSLILPYLNELIELIINPIHNAVRRNGLRMLALIDIPDAYSGILAEESFKILNNAREPVANRVFAMSVLWNIVKKYPEMGHELKVTIEEHMEYGSAGFKARGRKILKELDKSGYNN